MADGDNTDGGTGKSTEQTFTSEDVERIVRERLARERGKYADYGDLKAKAAQADAQKSDVDKLTDAVKALTERAEKAEREGIRRDVADRFKLPKFFADKMTGTTKEDLEREGKEIVDMLKTMGVNLDAGSTAGGKGTTDGSGSNGSGDAGKDGGQNGGGQSSTGGDGGSAGGNGTATTQDDGKTRTLLGARPTENLKSGAGTSGGGAQTVDSSKLADSILTRAF